MSETKTNDGQFFDEAGLPVFCPRCDSTVANPFCPVCILGPPSEAKLSQMEWRFRLSRYFYFNPPDTPETVECPECGAILDVADGDSSDHRQTFLDHLLDGCRHMDGEET